jgi:lysozyme
MSPEVLFLVEGLAKPFERLVLKPYHDPVGYPTIGYGHLLSREPWAPLSRWEPITEAAADDLLAVDIAKADRAVGRLCPVALTAAQRAALVDFAFNVGPGNLEISALRRKVNRGDFEGAAGEFGRWVFARGVKLPGLVRRRKAEAFLFAGG